MNIICGTIPGLDHTSIPKVYLICSFGELETKKGIMLFMSE